MNYELVKELREAGFPYPWVENDVFVPSLDQLIEACGDGFRHLFRYEDGSWAAMSSSITPEVSEIGAQNASTPEEAVARLWLVLNKE